MRIGDISSQPTLVKQMNVCDSLRKSDLVQRTSHPNLVNFTGMSRTEDGHYFSYETVGASLTNLDAQGRCSGSGRGQCLQEGPKHTSTLSAGRLTRVL